MTDLSALEKYFRETISAIAEVSTAVSTRSFNSIVPPKTAFPYHVFQLIPLDDKFGQAKTSIQSNFYIDSKFLSYAPPPEAVDDAVSAIKEYFRTSTSADANGYRISVRHQRPISYPENGATPEERIIHRGSTFFVSMHRLS